jgi:hypothetical protein
LVQLLILMPQVENCCLLEILTKQNHRDFRIHARITFVSRNLKFDEKSDVNKVDGNWFEVENLADLQIG